MKVLITGITGLVGRHLARVLSEQNYQIVGLSRRADLNKNIYKWDPLNEEIDLNVFNEIDGIIHLAGDNIAEGKWDSEKKRLIEESRTKSTAFLVKKVLELKVKPKFFISGSAIGYYGMNCGDELKDENSKAAHDFLAEVCYKWEEATKPLQDTLIRTCIIRIGVVLTTQGAALKKMLKPFKLGLGGPVGSGKQFMSWISIEDLVNSIQFLIEKEKEGVFNCVSPEPIRNRQFSKTLGQVLKRPAIFPLPEFMVKLLFGEMGDTLLLSSTKVEPKNLLAEGFKFRYPELKKALEYLIQFKK